MPIDTVWWLDGGIFWLVRRTTESDCLHVGHCHSTTRPTSFREPETTLVGDRKSGVVTVCIGGKKTFVYPSSGGQDETRREKDRIRIGDRRPLFADGAIPYHERPHLGPSARNQNISEALVYISQGIFHEDRTLRSALGICRLWAAEQIFYGIPEPRILVESPSSDPPCHLHSNIKPFIWPCYRTSTS